MHALKLRYVAAAMIAVVVSACDDTADKAREVANDAAAKARETADMGRESAQSTADGITSNGVAEVAPSALPTTFNMPATVVEFDEYSFDFGTASEGTVVTHNFRFTNMGSEPLAILGVEASCSCLSVEVPNREIAPGETAAVTLQFYSTNNRGQRNEKVTLAANTNPIKVNLSLSGLIEAGEEPQMPQ